MAKAHKNLYYSFFNDSLGDISNADITTRSGDGVWGTTIDTAIDGTGHPVNADLVSNNVVARCTTPPNGGHGFETYWKIRISYEGASTGYVLAPWFDDSAWSTQATNLANRAGEMYARGGAGIWFDPENFVNQGQWSYSSSDAMAGGHLGDSTATKRAKCLARGEQIGTAMAAAFPGMRLVYYNANATWPAGLDEFRYGTGAGGSPDYSSATDSALWPFILGLNKALTAAGCKFHMMDYYHYEPRSATRAANQMQYGNYWWFASMARGITTAYDQATWAACAQLSHYSPLLFLDGDSGLYYNPYSEAQIDTMYAAARDHGCDTRFGTFFLHPQDPSWYGGYDLAGADYLARADNMRAVDVAGSTSGDTAPSITITSGSLGAGGTITGQATGRRGVRYVYWTNGTLRYGATMTLKRASDGSAADPTTIDLDTMTSTSLRVDWTLTGLPAGGMLVAEDVHGQQATSGSITTDSPIGGRAAGHRVHVRRR